MLLVCRSDERDIERLCQRLSNGDLIHDHDDDGENHTDEELRQTASTTKHRYINTITSYTVHQYNYVIQR